MRYLLAIALAAGVARADENILSPGGISDSTMLVVPSTGPTTIFAAALTSPVGCQSTLTATTGQTITISRATSAVVDNLDGTVTTCTSNQARINANGVLIERAATNKVINSEAFDSWPTGASVTVTANSTVAPDGNTTADTLLATTNGALKQSTTFTSAAAKYAFSMYAKTTSGTQTWTMILYDTTASAAYKTCSGLTATTTWTRFECDGTSTATGAHNFAMQVLPGGAGQGTIIGWGAQVETVSQSPVAATSYIKTTAAAVTRNADNLTATVTSLSSGKFCVAFTAQTLSGQTTYQATDLWGFWQLGDLNNFAIDENAVSSDTATTYIQDKTGANPNTAWGSGLTAGSHRVIDCFPGTGTISRTIDGSTVTGVFSPSTYSGFDGGSLTALMIGRGWDINVNGSGQFGGYISSFNICLGAATAAKCP